MKPKIGKKLLPTSRRNIEKGKPQSEFQQILSKNSKRLFKAF